MVTRPSGRKTKEGKDIFEDAPTPQIGDPFISKAKGTKGQVLRPVGSGLARVGSQEEIADRARAQAQKEFQKQRTKEIAAARTREEKKKVEQRVAVQQATRQRELQEKLTRQFQETKKTTTEKKKKGTTGFQFATKETTELPSGETVGRVQVFQRAVGPGLVEEQKQIPIISTTKTTISERSALRPPTIEPAEPFIGKQITEPKKTAEQKLLSLVPKTGPGQLLGAPLGVVAGGVFAVKGIASFIISPIESTKGLLKTGKTFVTTGSFPEAQAFGRLVEAKPLFASGAVAGAALTFKGIGKGAAAAKAKITPGKIKGVEFLRTQRVPLQKGVLDITKGKQIVQFGKRSFKVEIGGITKTVPKGDQLLTASRFGVKVGKQQLFIRAAGTSTKSTGIQFFHILKGPKVTQAGILLTKRGATAEGITPSLTGQLIVKGTKLKPFSVTAGITKEVIKTPKGQLFFFKGRTVGGSKIITELDKLSKGSKLSDVPKVRIQALERVKAAAGRGTEAVRATGKAQQTILKQQKLIDSAPVVGGETISILKTKGPKLARAEFLKVSVQESKSLGILSLGVQTEQLTLPKTKTRITQVTEQKALITPITDTKQEPVLTATTIQITPPKTITKTKTAQIVEPITEPIQIVIPDIGTVPAAPPPTTQILPFGFGEPLKPGKKKKEEIEFASLFFKPRGADIIPFADLLSVNITELATGRKATQLPITKETKERFLETFRSGGSFFPTLEIERGEVSPFSLLDEKPKKKKKRSAKKDNLILDLL